MKRAHFISMILMAFILAVGCRTARALGEEDFGNAPLNAANFTEWPGIMPVVNHSSRVYHVWVNGNEQLYYRGDITALNDMLRKFAAAQSAVLEVVLRPAPGVTHAFDNTTTIPFGWNLHLTGGIARHVITLDQGDKVWTQNPVLSVYVGNNLDLKRLRIPKALKVVSLSELKQRTREALIKSTDKTVRGWGAGELASLDPYDAESSKTITGLLKDADDWVRLNAVLALAEFGSKAQPALPMLHDVQNTDDKQLKEQTQKSIEAITHAEDKSVAEQNHQDQMERINRFLSRRK